MLKGWIGRYVRRMTPAPRSSTARRPGLLPTASRRTRTFTPFRAASIMASATCRPASSSLKMYISMQTLRLAARIAFVMAEKVSSPLRRITAALPAVIAAPRPSRERRKAALSTLNWWSKRSVLLFSSVLLTEQEAPGRMQATIDARRIANRDARAFREEAMSISTPRRRHARRRFFMASAFREEDAIASGGFRFPVRGPGLARSGLRPPTARGLDTPLQHFHQVHHVLRTVGFLDDDLSFRGEKPPQSLPVLVGMLGRGVSRPRAVGGRRPLRARPGP